MARFHHLLFPALTFFSKTGSALALPNSDPIMWVTASTTVYSTEAGVTSPTFTAWVSASTTVTETPYASTPGPTVETEVWITVTKYSRSSTSTWLSTSSRTTASSTQPSVLAPSHTLDTSTTTSAQPPTPTDPHPFTCALFGICIQESQETPEGWVNCGVNGKECGEHWSWD